jgi:hypothetical protein
MHADARSAAVEVLLNNLRGPVPGLPRTAAWGYPEPYTRDMMLSSFGFLTQTDTRFHGAVRAVLEALAHSQSPLGQISSLANDPTDMGSSDTTPLFLVGLALYRRQSGEAGFLQEAADRAFQWMRYQRPNHTTPVAQLPTSDWRDEQWVLGYGLYVNALYYMALCLHGYADEAASLQSAMSILDLGADTGKPGHPYYALWAYKVYRNDRFDLMGNSLAILSGLFTRERATQVIDWVETTCAEMRQRGDLAVGLPACLMPFIQRGDADWYPRLEQFNLPGAYHNGGIWPFVSGFYIAALAHTGLTSLAAERLNALTDTVRQSRRGGLAFGFNEWYQAQTGLPQGQDWQTWSAAVYLYALESVESGAAPFFDRGFPSVQASNSGL